MRFLDTSRIRTRFDERVRAADGIELSVDLYLPPRPGRYPILLTRTASDNNNRAGRAGNSPTEARAGGANSSAPAERWKSLAAHGYIIAAADVRGRGDSDGAFVPFEHEAADGAATIAWLRELQEFNGGIGLFGSGYSAFCAWAGAVRDRHVDAIASISPFGSVGKGLVHRSGAVRLDWLFWMHLIGGRTVQPANVPPWPTIHRHLPLSTQAEALGRDDIWWRDWLAHLESSDPFWAALDLADEIANLEMPGLHITGWWDDQSSSTHDYYRAACRGGAPQQLIVGPWNTSATRYPVRQVGGIDFGPRAVLDLDETLLAFFDACLRHEDTLHVPHSRIFVTGRNEWLNAEDESFRAGRMLNLYASSSLGANTRCGDGVLTAAAPGRAGVDTMTHNPALPVEFQPQFRSFAAGANPLGFTLDQSHITAVDEALVYTAEPLDQPITVFGQPRVTLSVRTHASDADLYVLLSDCFPLGAKDLHLSHAAIRLATLPQFRPGEWFEVELELDRIAHDFLTAHQIRLTVVPSLFPLYARNPQTGAYTSGSQSIVADIELRHGYDAQLCLTLPLTGAT